MPKKHEPSRWPHWLRSLVRRRADRDLGDETPGNALATGWGGYRIESELGAGTLGRVYRARRTATGLPVALKVIDLAQVVGDEERDEMLARLDREVAATQRLSHPDIVRVLASGRDRGKAWIAMELIEGGNLSQYAQRQGRLGPHLVAAIGVRLAQALASAHQAGIVHRDLKPANVLVDLQRRQVKLADFGLARIGDVARTRTGLAMGSPWYMAREQLAAGVVGPAADIYALGVLLYELSCSRPPFEANSLGELLQQVALAPPPDLRRLRPDAPAELAQAAAWAMTKDSRQRPRTALELAEVLTPCADPLWLAREREP